MTLDIEQDSKIAPARTRRGLGVVQAFDVSLQSLLRAFHLSQNLCAFARSQSVKAAQCSVACSI